jgi:hypothetical protein
MKEQYDDKSGYCRMLGPTLGFNYCRRMQEGLPCYNILNCWFERFPVEEFIGENYSTEEQKLIFKPPKKKLDALAEVLNNVSAKDRATR